MSRYIQSLHNERIKKAVRLRDHRGRQQQGKIIIDGRREVRRALEARIAVCELFVSETQQDEPEIQALITLASGACPLTLVAHSIFDKLAFGHRSEGVVLVAETPHCSLDSIPPAQLATVCVLESVEKPGNVGAIVRSADAAGIAAVIVADARSDLYNPNTIRASLGAIFHLPCCAATTPQVQQWLQQRGFQIFAARVDGAVSYSSLHFPGQTALVLGNEASGLSSQWQGLAITPIALPMLGVVDSLNVSVTAAVLFYEVLRQRQSRT
jgi:TrmH family RNA methyltransferase